MKNGFRRFAAEAGVLAAVAIGVAGVAAVVNPPARETAPAESRTAHAGSARAGSNHLAGQPSAYLSGAARQPVDWYPWEPEAFAAAQRQDKPILLDVGAVWCHWCHVMDREDYENPEIAKLINENFIAIKVDRDERPDIDRRYQLAVQAVGGSNGWPLTAFLTPTGEVYFGGTYFAPEDGPLGPGLRTLLPKLADFYQANKKEIDARSTDLVAKLAEIGQASSGAGKFSAATLAGLGRQILGRFDWKNGGFHHGPGPRFPDGGAIDFLMAESTLGGSERDLQAATFLLDEMADGGIYDRVGGGFHRYSTDMFWRVPHFEKMAYDQAALLENYLHAYQATGHPLYREVAGGIVDYVLATLSSPRGGFYAFQDADVSANDDGSYYTWTKKELRQALSPEEFKVVEARFSIVNRPDQFSEFPERQVLAVRADWDTVAKATGTSQARAEKLLASALGKLRAVRSRRKAPFVDTTVFADLNGMMIRAFLDAWRVLGREDAKKRALDSFDFVRTHLLARDGTFLHAYGKGEGRGEGLLADQVWMADAAVDVYLARGRAEDLTLAKSLMEGIWKTHRDKDHGGFFDLPPGLHADNAYLSEPIKTIEDNPEPSANAVAILVFERLFAITGASEWSDRARATLDAFAGAAPSLGPFAGAYGEAAFVFLHPGAHVVIVGPRASPAVAKLRSAAFGAFRPGSTVAVYGPTRAGAVPPVVAAQIARARSEKGPIAYVCVGTQCSLPTAEPSRVAELVRSFGRK
jgi:uncharacterized protein